MRLTEKVHAILQTELQAGDFVIDATAGNGHDSLALANLIGAQGRLWAIDIQEQAIAATRQRLRSVARPPKIELLQADHALTLQVEIRVMQWTHQPRFVSCKLYVCTLVCT